MNTREVIAKIAAALGLTPSMFLTLLATHVAAFIAGALLF